MQCWNCGETLNLTTISFREICEKCSAYLHCCKNCRHYKPGLSNDCAIPGTEPIADRTANNYCEEFKVLGIGPSLKSDAAEAEKRLFGEISQKKEPEDPTQRFKSLFRDD